MPQRIDALQTPCALVDLDRVERNTRRMSERVSRLGARLRPHVKTHKTREAARLQVRGHFGGITVSTLAEAHYFAEAGYRDITYAVPIAPARIPEAIELGRATRLNLVLDSERALHELESAAATHRVRIPVYLKVDCGLHRSGVDPTTEAPVALAARLGRSEQIDFRGILTHAGQSYDCRDRAGIAEVARHERDVMIAFAERLRRKGIRVDEVSIGSTPTLAVAENLTGITEVRPGNYVFYDAFQAAIGACELEDVAFFVLATVIGSFPDRIVTDAGALAVSKDRGARHVDPEAGYGLIASADGATQYEQLRLEGLTQEHGVVKAHGGGGVLPLEVGTRVRVIPNHSCLAAAMFDRYFVTRGNAIVDEWRPARGW